MRPPPGSTLFPTRRSSDLRVALSAAGIKLHQPRRTPQQEHEHTRGRSEEHTSELQSLRHLVCRPLPEKKKQLANDQHGQDFGGPEPVNENVGPDTELPCAK